MSKLNISEYLDFNNEDLTAPNKVIEELAEELAKETHNIVCAKIEAYTGFVSSYTKILSGLTDVLGPKEEYMDVQKTLGKQGDKSYKYEFYLFTPSFQDYKFRICFVEYGLSNYPVRVTLEESVATSISRNNYTLTCNSREEFERLIIAVLNSKRIINVIQELIRIKQVYQKSLEYTTACFPSKEEVEANSTNQA